MMNITETIRFEARVTVSRIRYDKNPGYIHAHAEEDVRRYLTEYLLKQKSEVIKTPDMMEIRLALYVATPAEFWKIVRQEAERIQRL